jgi:hypothetical protein
VTWRVPWLPPWPVVKTENVTIDEYFGNASSSTPEISIAHVKSKGVWQEEWQVGSPASLVNVLADLEHPLGLISMHQFDAAVQPPISSSSKISSWHNTRIVSDLSVMKLLALAQRLTGARWCGVAEPTGTSIRRVRGDAEGANMRRNPCIDADTDGHQRRLANNLGDPWVPLFS